jgi:uncharacterized ferritin-like protein (DUF455 family)
MLKDRILCANYEDAESVAYFEAVSTFVPAALLQSPYKSSIEKKKVHTHISRPTLYDIFHIPFNLWSIALKAALRIDTLAFESKDWLI